MPGQIGLIQATEVLKFILGRGNPLIGRFLIYDALESDFTVFSTNRNEECPLCGKKPTIMGLAHGHYREQISSCAP